MINFFKFRTLFFSWLMISSLTSFAWGTYTVPFLEVKGGYFSFSDSKMRNVYDKGGLDLQLCGSYPAWNMACRWTLHGYGAVEYFQRSGKSIHGHQHTSLWSIPINVGIKPVYTINDNLRYYLGAGPRFFYIHQHNSSSYVCKHRSRNGIGFFINTGFNYHLWDCLVIDIFGEYSNAKVHFHSGKSRVYTRSVQIGGFTVGGGVGYQF